MRRVFTESVEVSVASFGSEVFGFFAVQRETKVFYLCCRMSKNGNPPPYSPPYGQQPPGFYQPPAEQPVIISPPGPTVVVSQAVPVGPTPTSTQCPSCHANIVTTMETETTTKTHVIALLLCLIGCWPCCLIPYCTDSCQAKTHYCPNCRAYLGKFDS